jgi:hypothetical protein
MRALVDQGLEGAELEERFKEGMGKNEAWRSSETTKDFMRFTLNYLRDLSNIHDASGYVSGRKGGTAGRRMSEARVPPSFVKGRIYERTWISQHYGGDIQKGISPSASNNLIFLYTGPHGKKRSYKGGW